MQTADSLQEISTQQNNSDSITLYHGSSNAILLPTYGLGEDKHDYGKGLYLTPDIQLAKEWAVCTGEYDKGYVYRIEMELSSLSLLDFDALPVEAWIAELMSHRAADNKSARYARLAPQFISKYKPKDIHKYDVIKGWRADSSYFSIVKRFVRDEVDIELIPELFTLGDLGIQYCIKSEKAFSLIHREYLPVCEVDAKTYYEAYRKKDNDARVKVQSIIESDMNTMTHGFSALL